MTDEELEPAPEETDGELEALRLLRIQTGDLARIRMYVGVIALAVIVNTMTLSLWLAGVIETSTKVVRSPFG